MISLLFYRIDQIVLSALNFSHYITTAAESCLLTKGQYVVASKTSFLLKVKTYLVFI